MVGGTGMKLMVLVGSGDRIGLLTLPFLVIGLILNMFFPSLFGVGGPPSWLRVISIIILVPGIAIWIWTVALILIHVPKKELITTGPYSWVKHPLYTNMNYRLELFYIEHCPNWNLMMRNQYCLVLLKIQPRENICSIYLKLII